MKRYLPDAPGIYCLWEAQSGSIRCSYPLPDGARTTRNAAPSKHGARAAMVHVITEIWALHSTITGETTSMVLR